MQKRKVLLTTLEMTKFAIFGGMMFAFKYIEGIPNVHPLALLTVIFTVVYRAKALWILAGFDLLVGITAGFGIWWVPYLYLWTILWGVTMLMPKKMHPATAAIVYSILCAAHGFLYGTLYAPYQALVFGYNWQGMIAWIASGLPYDLIHGVSNLAMSVLTVPLITLLKKLEKQT